MALPENEKIYVIENVQYDNGTYPLIVSQNVLSVGAKNTVDPVASYGESAVWRCSIQGTTYRFICTTNSAQMFLVMKESSSDQGVVNSPSTKSVWTVVQGSGSTSGYYAMRAQRVSTTTAAALTLSSSGAFMTPVSGPTRDSSKSSAFRFREVITPASSIQISFDMSMGTVTYSPDPSSVHFEGVEITATAVPAEGYRFVRWSDNGSPLPSRTIISGTAVSAEAVFATEEEEEAFLPTVFPRPWWIDAFYKYIKSVFSGIKGASKVGAEDIGSYFESDTVEGQLQEIGTKIRSMEEVIDSPQDLLSKLPSELTGKTAQNADTASNLGSITSGDGYQPVYFMSGTPVPCSFKIAIVTALPTSPDPNTLYFVK